MQFLNRRSPLAPIIMIIISLLIFFYRDQREQAKNISSASVYPSNNRNNQTRVKVKVRYVADADTFYVNLNGRDTLVRLIGIDAPETKSSPHAQKQSTRFDIPLRTIYELGEWSKAQLKKELPKGTMLELEFDLLQEDRYGRTLVYAFLPDGQLLNEKLVMEGIAWPYKIKPNTLYEERISNAAKYAQKNRLGIFQY